MYMQLHYLGNDLSCVLGNKRNVAEFLPIIEWIYRLFHAGLGASIPRVRGVSQDRQRAFSHVCFDLEHDEFI